MSHVVNDLQYYNNLFSKSSTSIKDQSLIIGWSERRCYLFKYFIRNLGEEELEILKRSSEDIDPEIIGAICVHQAVIRKTMFNQLERIINASSPFDEIQLIYFENSEPNPLNKISNQFWKFVKIYLEQLEIDSYPFNKKAINFLRSVANTGYINLSDPQKKWLDSLIEADRTRAATLHYFVNEFLIQEGFSDDCKLIEQVWTNH